MPSVVKPLHCMAKAPCSQVFQGFMRRCCTAKELCSLANPDFPTLQGQKQGVRVTMKLEIMTKREALI